MLLRLSGTTGRLCVLPGINRSIEAAHPARPVGGRPVARQDGPARFPPPAPAACTAGGTRFPLTAERRDVQPMRARREEEEERSDWRKWTDDSMSFSHILDFLLLSSCDGSAESLNSDPSGKSCCAKFVFRLKFGGLTSRNRRSFRSCSRKVKSTFSKPDLSDKPTPRLREPIFTQLEGSCVQAARRFPLFH